MTYSVFSFCRGLRTLIRPQHLFKSNLLRKRHRYAISPYMTPRLLINLYCCVQGAKVAAAPACERRDTTRAKRGANTTLNVATAYKRRRVKWTHSELAFVREWATQNQTEQGKRWRWTECVAAGKGILHAAHAAGGNVKDAAKRLGLVTEQQSEKDTAASRPAVVVLPASHDTASSSSHSN